MENTLVGKEFLGILLLVSNLLTSYHNRLSEIVYKTQHRFHKELCLLVCLFLVVVVVE